MPVKKQIPSLCKLYSFYEEIPEEFLDGTDVDSYFYHNIFDNSQSQHLIVWVSRGPNKNHLQSSCSSFASWRHSNVLSSKKRRLSPKENSLVWSTICAIFSKLLIKLANAYRFPYRSPRLRLDLQSRKTISLLITITISLNIQIDKFVYHSNLETTILAYFPSKILNYTAMNLFLQKLSTLTIVKFTISSSKSVSWGGGGGHEDPNVLR